MKHVKGITAIANPTVNFINAWFSFEARLHRLVGEKQEPLIRIPAKRGMSTRMNCAVQSDLHSLPDPRGMSQSRSGRNKNKIVPPEQCNRNILR
jgi:hypothetical protein